MIMIFYDDDDDMYDDDDDMYDYDDNDEYL